MKKTPIILSLLLSSNIAFANWQDIAGSVLKTVTDTTKEDNVKTSETTSLSNTTISNGLKEALEKGVKSAVESLGKENGYYSNELVKIDLPENLAKVKTLVEKAGGASYVKDLELAMNDAASEAAPKTASIFLKAVENMSIDDAKEILNGKDNAATTYFKSNTLDDLKKLISPIVEKSISNNQVASYYNSFNEFYKSNVKSYVDNSSLMSYAKSFGADKYIPSSSDENLNDYITNKAIDGLFIMIEKEEKAIRENPVERTTSILKKVFGN